ncbi:MAG: hypothetical protein Q7T72_14855 [Bacteroidales bacterium]|nr:hypothetical protein [Bacteroidales bacterium]MDP3002940.1 hypothetical protein [Bacteroidales bacterium]
MKRNSVLIFGLLSYFCLVGCKEKSNVASVPITNAKGQQVYQDMPYLQDYSVRYYLKKERHTLKLSSISSNRDGQIRILSDSGLLVPDNGSLFYSGKLIPDISYPPLISKKISAIGTYRNQTIYLDDQQVFSNAWAGKIQIEHGLPGASVFAGGKDFQFLVSDGEHLVYLDQDGNKLWTGYFKGIRQILYQEMKNSFLLISPELVAEFTPGQPIIELYKGSGITCAASIGNKEKIIVGTTASYFFLSDNKIIHNVPCPEITNIKEIKGQLWFGSVLGAYRLNTDGKYSYYAGERWLPGNRVIAIESGPENSILVLTEKGLGQICFKEMTLEDKAMFFEKQVREKNIRYGFNCSVSRLPQGYSSAQMASQPSDNLWTGMYLASQLFRYKVTGSEDAKQNAYEAFEAMERLYTVTNIPGLFARSFERDYKVENTKEDGWERKELLSGSPASLWLPASDHHNWTWRSTASSDQTVGQIFALTMVLELSDDEQWKARALKCLDDLMGYIVKNDLYIIDVDGEPTLWGKWNPDYVNKFPVNVGDRRLNSSNIIAFLQTAYRFTGKEIYKNKANELIEKYGYLENLTRPISQIGPSEADEISKVLSAEWNHSDDEMYFLAYWGLQPYAFTAELKTKFQASIKDHWEVERPEKNALWNFTYAMTGAKDFDLDQSIWFLKSYPLDLRNWGMQNSHRKDIEVLPANFRGQTTRELLPLSEIPLYRHNGQIFNLDSAGDGNSLISAGDVWLLPYWMGRYLGVIM